MQFNSARFLSESWNGGIKTKKSDKLDLSDGSVLQNFENSDKKGAGKWGEQKILDSSINSTHSSLSQHFAVKYSTFQRVVAEAANSDHSLYLYFLEGQNATSGEIDHTKRCETTASGSQVEGLIPKHRHSCVLCKVILDYSDAVMLLMYHFGINSVRPKDQHSHFASCHDISKFFTLYHNKSTSLVCRVQQRRCVCYDLHKELVAYKDAWDWQLFLVESRKEKVREDKDFEDTVMVLQHYPVYTLGTGSSESFLKFDMRDAPYALYRTERGGEVTYHGPGQLVMYPIMNLRYHKMDLHWYLRALEEVIIRVLSSAFSIKASRLEGFTGVWVGNQKVAAIGVRVSKWISFHGLALNVTTDLSPFEQIVPCGIMDRQVGSIKGLLAEQSSSKFNDSQIIDLAHAALLKEFSDVFQIELQHSDKLSQDLFTT